MKKLYFLIVFIFLIGHGLKIYSQESEGQLVITEVNINVANARAWIEITNPTDKVLKLSSFRISGVKTTNILPPWVRKHDGIKLVPKERIVICSDSSLFKAEYGNTLKVIEVQSLKYIDDGGYMTINQMKGIEDLKNVIRFGNKNKSAALVNIIDDSNVLMFSNDGLSYSRRITDKGDISKWVKTIPSPGK